MIGVQLPLPKPPTPSSLPARWLQAAADGVVATKILTRVSRGGRKQNLNE